MSALDIAREALADFESGDDIGGAADCIAALRKLVAEHERMIASPLVETVDLSASVTLDPDALEPATDIDGMVIQPSTESAVNQAEREHVARILRSLGLTDEPDKYSDGIHSWRCEHPDRYGKCSCFDEAVDYVLKAGFRRRGPVTDEMVEAAVRRWYGIALNPKDMAYPIMRAALEAAEAAR